RPRDRPNAAGADEGRPVRPSVHVDRADRRARPGAGRLPLRSRPPPARVDLLRRDRGDPHRLGPRPAAGRGRRRGTRGADRGRRRLRGDGGPLIFRRSTAWILGLGAFGLAFSLTITATCLPFILSKFTDSTALIGVILGAEGVFALVVSPVIGPWSDSFHTPLGRRRPFMLAALGPLGFCLLMMPFMPNVWTVTLVVLAFFFAYYVYEPPYRGLYPDLVPREYLGRSQGVQHQLRGIALLFGSVGGTLLLKVWSPSPFLVTSVVHTAAWRGATTLTHEEGGHSRVFDGVRTYISQSWRIFRHERDLRRF